MYSLTKEGEDSLQSDGQKTADIPCRRLRQEMTLAIPGVTLSLGGNIVKSDFEPPQIDSM